METLDKSALFEQTIHVDWAFVRGALPKESGDLLMIYYDNYLLRHLVKNDVICRQNDTFYARTHPLFRSPKMSNKKKSEEAPHKFSHL